MSDCPLVYSVNLHWLVQSEQDNTFAKSELKPLKTTSWHQVGISITYCILSFIQLSNVIIKLWLVLVVNVISTVICHALGHYSTIMPIQEPVLDAILLEIFYSPPLNHSTEKEWPCPQNHHSPPLGKLWMLPWDDFEGLVQRKVQEIILLYKEIWCCFLFLCSHQNAPPNEAKNSAWSHFIFIFCSDLS